MKVPLTIVPMAPLPDQCPGPGLAHWRFDIIYWRLCECACGDRLLRRPATVCRFPSGQPVGSGAQCTRGHPVSRGRDDTRSARLTVGVESGSFQRERGLDAAVRGHGGKRSAHSSTATAPVAFLIFL
jgi:hypothetical protein